jgi:long-subunit acyl-CoA synthetase (AMP-forming)
MSLGIFVFEVYGMSETTGPATWNRPGKWKIGTIGETVEGVKFKLNEDSEMMFQGKTMMKQYKDNPEATKKTIDPMTGWLATGDVGDIDEDGFISITERKKEILITAGGENVAPAIQESKIRSYPGISQVVLIGDKQKFISALVTANLPEVQTLIESEGWTVQDFGRTKVSDVTYKDLISFKKYEAYVDARVKKVGSYFPKAHRVKKWVFLPADFSAEGKDPEMTPTMKMKRRVIFKKYKKTIIELYGDAWKEYDQGKVGLQAKKLTGAMVREFNERRRKQREKMMKGRRGSNVSSMFSGSMRSISTYFSSGSSRVATSSRSSSGKSFNKSGKSKSSSGKMNTLKE